ncbi:MAG: hypothetical protein HC888_05915 [Candidatus Competibacteraceae bacterium]|nr:hypothetical protein [Candidatus Competibacteraceae bacterium]
MAFTFSLSPLLPTQQCSDLFRGKIVDCHVVQAQDIVPLPQGSVVTGASVVDYVQFVMHAAVIEHEAACDQPLLFESDMVAHILGCDEGCPFVPGSKRQCFEGDFNIGNSA